VAVGASALLIAQIALTWRQASYWTNSIVLFERTLAVTRDNWFIEDNLGRILLRRGRFAEATVHLQESLRIEPRNTLAHAHMATVMMATGHVEEGIAGYEHALELDPAFTDARNDLGLAYLRAGRVEEAVATLTRVAHDRPEAPSHFNLALAFERQGNLGAALGEYVEALRLDPGLASARERRDAVVERLAAATGTRPAATAASRR
jgi:Tfp pilus assembly protein PilF